MSQIFSTKSIKEASAKAAKNMNKPRRESNNFESEDDEEKDIHLHEHKDDDETASKATSSTTTYKCLSTESSSALIEPATETVELAKNKLIAQVMQRSNWNIKTSLENYRHDYKKICSICLSDSPAYCDDRNFLACITAGTSATPSASSSFGSGTSILGNPGSTTKYDDIRNPLITPCLCAENRSHQHKRCIENWIEQTGATSCPFCFVRYDYSRGQKSFWSYIKDCELRNDFLVSLTAFTFAIYLFLVGLAVCCHFVFTTYSCHIIDLSPEQEQSAQQKHDDERRHQLLWSKFVASLVSAIKSCWSLLEPVADGATDRSSAAVTRRQRLECQLSRQQYDEAHSWTSVLLFGFICTSTVLLFVGIVSMSLNITFHHYVRYWLWSRTNFKVNIRPYSLGGLSEAAPAAASSPLTAVVGLRQQQGEQKQQVVATEDSNSTATSSSSSAAAAVSTSQAVLDNANHNKNKPAIDVPGQQAAEGQTKPTSRNL